MISVTYSDLKKNIYCVDIIVQENCEKLKKINIVSLQVTAVCMKQGALYLN